MSYENTDINKLLFGFFLVGSNASGRPGNADGTLAMASFLIPEAGTVRGFQIAISLVNAVVYIRKVLNSVYADWKIITTS